MFEVPPPDPKGVEEAVSLGGWGELVGDPEPESLAWLLSEANVTWGEPDSAELGPPPPPPDVSEVDRLVQRQIIDCHSERVHLQKRIEVVHKSAQEEAEDACGITMRALWAIPLVLLAGGFAAAQGPLTGCCTAGERAPPERLVASGPDESAPEDAPAASAGAAGEDAASRRAEALPSGSGREQPNVGAREGDSAGAIGTSSLADSGPSTRIDTSINAAPVGNGSGAGSSVAEEGAAANGASATNTGPALELGPKEGAEGANAAVPKAARPKRRGDARSAVSVSQNMQSSMGVLLAGVAKGDGGRRPKSSPKEQPPGSEASVLNAKAAPALPSVAESPPPQPPPAKATPAEKEDSPPQEVVAKPPAEKAESGGGERRRPGVGARKSGDSRTVVSNFQGGSAAGNLLGPLAMKPKAKAKSRTSDSKSVI